MRFDASSLVLQRWVAVATGYVGFDVPVLGVLDRLTGMAP
jgi:hypothetical protein